MNRNKLAKVTPQPARKTHTQMVVAALVVLSTILAPIAAIAQDQLPGGTIPDSAAATTGTAAELYSVDNLSAVPAGPNGFSGGVIAADTAVETQASFPIDVTGVDSDITTLESIPTVDSSSFSAPVTYSPLGEAPSYIMHLPNVQWEHNPHAMPLLGFGAGAKNITTFADIRKLNAGWYVDWSVAVNPPEPTVEYVQMVRLHQVIDTTKVYDPNTGKMCGISVTADRTICPYASPPQYVISPPVSTIQAAAAKNPGSTWLIGNEMERYDWVGGRQDEILPEIYAFAFRDVRAIIKAADPTAKIAIGGVIQFTPLRQQWLDRVWTQYRLITGHAIDQDIDVFNIHNFIGSERCDVVKNAAINNRNERTCTGMGIPVGVTGTQVGNAQLGAYIGQDNRHLDMGTATRQGTFQEQIINFRTWMKAKNPNNVNKPLIVSEYGALYAQLCPTGDTACVDFYRTNPLAQPWGYVDYTNPAVVQNFMTASFDFFNTATDCTLSSQSANGCKLVQRWAWFGLEDIGWNFNSHGALINLNTGKMTATGQIFSTWGKNH